MTGSQEYKRGVDAALAARESGDLRTAHRLTKSLIARGFRRAGLFELAGHICWELKLLEEAVAHFREAVALAPTSERKSLGLFHCLWECGESDAAFDEARRFVSLSPSEEYREIMEGIRRECRED